MFHQHLDNQQLLKLLQRNDSPAAGAEQKRIFVPDNLKPVPPLLSGLNYTTD